MIQYWSVFSGILGKSGQYLVSILGKSGQYSGQFTDFFSLTTVVITADQSLNCCKMLVCKIHNGLKIQDRSLDLTRFNG